MADGQFTIPGTPEMPMNEQLRQDVAALYEPTTQPEQAPLTFARHKQIETDIEAMRAGMTEADLPRSAKMRVLELFTSKPRPLEERLVEEESRIGGALFSANPDGESSIVGQRFWFYNGAWLHERYVDNGQKGISELVIRYRLENDAAHKLIGGQSVPFSNGELQLLLDAIELYHEVTQRELYTRKDDYGLAA